MNSKNIGFILGFTCCTLTVTAILTILILVGKGERASGRKPVETADKNVTLVAQSGSQEQKPERPPEKGNGRRDQ